MLAQGFPSSFFRTSVPAVAEYGIFIPLTVISWVVRDVVSTAGAAGGVGSGLGAGFCADNVASEAKVRRMEIRIYGLFRLCIVCALRWDGTIW